MRSLNLYRLVSHRDESPGLTRPRHPIVVYSNICFLVFTGFYYYSFAQKTFGQDLYFVITALLLLSSAAFHTWQSNRVLHFFDQIMISAYIIVVPIPFLYKEPMALSVFFLSLLALCYYKWFEKKSAWKTRAIVFLVMSSTSLYAILKYGLPNIGESASSIVGQMVILASILFFLQFILYWFKGIKIIPNVCESIECGHFSFMTAASIINIIVINYPV